MNTRERSATTFVVTLRPAVAGIDGIRALRATLKFALRHILVKPISPPIEKKPPPKRRKGIDDLDSPTDF
jgi:hypothetical protein